VAGERRRRSTVRVPNVIGMSWDEARDVLRSARLVAVGPDPDGPPLAALGWPDGVVTDQSPESGAKLPPGSPVILWVERGGGSGVREPRRPEPRPRAGYAMRDEPSDEAVG
jgi:beta-lactam-binding protein with PASTA domain